MKAILVGLSVASAAAAQLVNGYSMVTLTSSSSAATSSAASYASSSTGYYGSSAPPEYTQDASSSYAVPPSQYTSPPSSSMDIYQMMPYSSMTEGGYSSLDCGYGYSKSSDGSCQSMSWVSLPYC